MSFKKTLKELKEHSPFTFFATLIAILLIIIIRFYFSKDIPESFFHIAHPAHVFVSAKLDKIKKDKSFLIAV